MLIRPVLVSAAAAALTIVPLTSASAATYRHTDTTQDLRSADLSSNTMTLTDAPDATEPDVTSIKVVHGARKVSVTMLFADLTRKPAMAEYAVEVRTNEKELRIADVSASSGHWKGHATLQSRKGDEKCAGLTHAIDYDKNSVSIGIPRSCLSNPRWIQVAAMAMDVVMTTTTSPDGSQSTSTTTAYLDDAQSSTFRQRETWSPRIKKG